MPTLLAVMAVAVGLVAGCSSGSTTETNLPDAAGLLQQSSAATKGVTSAHVDIAVDGKVQGLPLKKLSGDLTNVPATAVQGDATITMGGSDLDVGLVVIDGNLYAALTPNNWLDMGKAADVYDPSAILNPDNGLANLVGSFTDAKSEATEKVNGVDTVRITGTISADAMNKLIPQLKVSGPIPGTAWVEKDGDHRLVQVKVEPNSGGSIQVTLSDWNKPVTVTKPKA